MPPTDVTSLIRTELPRLAPSLRKVGELILADPAAVTHSSAAELGRRTGTSQATVTRFCRAIGLDSYQHLLIELAQERGRGEVSDWGSAEIGPEISPDDDLERVVTVVGSADLRAVQQTIDRMDLDALERAAQAVARARRIDVYGVGGSGAVAQETETRLFRIGCSVRGWNEVHGAATSAALLTPADVAIAISHSGATRGIEPFELAKERGATTVALTSDPALAAGPGRRHPADLRHLGNQLPHREHQRPALRTRPHRLPLRPGRPALLPARERLTGADRPHHPAAHGEEPPYPVIPTRGVPTDGAPTEVVWMNHREYLPMVV